MRPAPRHGYIRRPPALAALAAVLGLLAALAAGSAAAAPLSDCTAHRGTIVAVDFAHWGGPIVRGCGINSASGFALLHAAGFTTAGDAHDGPAFICRLGNQAFDRGAMYPTPSEDPCILTPSTSAYWSYWVAPAGQRTWTYAPLGAMGDVPKPGEVELWIFGATNVGGTRGSGVPKFSPSTLRAANRPPSTRTTSTQTTSAPSTTTTATATTSSTPTPTTTSTTTPTRTTTAAAPAAAAPARRVRTQARRSDAKRPPVTRRRRPRRTARTPPQAPRPPRAAAVGSVPVVSARPTGEHTSSGSAAPLAVGLCLALALAAGAGWTVWRRRRYE